MNHCVNIKESKTTNKYSGVQSAGAVEYTNCFPEEG